VGVVILSALVAHTGWHWMVDRGGRFLAYDLRLPEMDAALAEALLDWILLGLVVAAAAWTLSLTFARLARRGAEGQDMPSMSGPVLDSPGTTDGAATVG
jgi:hypothetical protein